MVDTGSTYSVLTSYSGAFSSQTCTILGATGKTITKIFTWAFLCCLDGQIFSHQFLGVPECPTALLGRNISYLWNLAAIAVLIEDALKLSLGDKLFLPSTARSQHEDLCLWQRSLGRRFGIRKGGIEPQESPWKFSSIYPQNQSLPNLLIVLSPTPLTLRGAVPHHLFRRRS